MKASVVHGCRLLCVINHHAIRDAPVARSVNSRDPSPAGNAPAEPCNPSKITHSQQGWKCVVDCFATALKINRYGHLGAAF
jgi:hypothetical protein